MRTFPTNSWRASEALALRMPYKTHGAMQAVDGYFLPFGHRLPEQWAEQYRRDGAHRIIYTVLSYATPIAWVLESGEIRIPDEKYSVTTTAHQGHLYALTQPADSFSERADAEAARARHSARERREEFNSFEAIARRTGGMTLKERAVAMLKEPADYAPVRMEYSESYSIRQGWATSTVEQHASGVELY